MLDRATFALQTDAGPAVARQWGWSLAAIPATRVVDGSAKELAVTIRPFYPLRGDVPAHLELQLWFINKRVVTVKPTEFPVTVKVPLPPLGDWRAGSIASSTSSPMSARSCIRSRSGSPRSPI